MNKTEALVTKMNILGGMNALILDYYGDTDEIIDYWFTFGVEDGADEDTLEEIAEDEQQFVSVCRVFANCINNSLGFEKNY